MGVLISLICGTIFGIGVTISGMTNPSQVLAFFDIFGDWDPTLAYVMGGALTVTSVGHVIVRRLGEPLLGGDPPKTKTSLRDTKLFLGATLFGIGWGLVGFCPGPLLASLSRGSVEVMIFAGAMVLGMLVWRLFDTFRLNRS